MEASAWDAAAMVTNRVPMQYRIKASSGGEPSVRFACCSTAILRWPENFRRGWFQPPDTLSCFRPCTFDLNLTLPGLSSWCGCKQTLETGPTSHLPRGSLNSGCTTKTIESSAVDATESVGKAERNTMHTDNLCVRSVSHWGAGDKPSQRP